MIDKIIASVPIIVVALLILKIVLTVIKLERKARRRIKWSEQYFDISSEHKASEWGRLERRPPYAPHRITNEQWQHEMEKTKMRASQRGFALLLECIVLMAVMLVLAAVAVPNLNRVRFDRQSADAKNLVIQTARVRASLIICSVQLPLPCIPPTGLTALLPLPGSVLTTDGYMFAMSSDGQVYTATPINPSVGQGTYSVGPNGVVMCGTAPCN